MSDQDNTAIGKAIGRIPSGCGILTAGDVTTGTGMLCSWVQQCSFDPPAISVCVKKGRPIEAELDRTRAFVLNVIGEDTAKMFKHFGKGFGPGEPAFTGLVTSADPHGVILKDAIAHLACKLTGKHDTGDHFLYTGRVVSAAASDAKPYVHVRKNGMDY